jgi:hypothetical protein
MLTYADVCTTDQQTVAEMLSESSEPEVLADEPLTEMLSQCNEALRTLQVCVCVCVCVWCVCMRM